MLSEYYETDGGTAVSFSLSQELRSPPWQLAGGKKISFSKAACRHARDTSVLSCRFCNCVCKGRIGQNGDAESHVLVSEYRMLYGISELVSWKHSLSSPVILHFMSLQLLALITGST